MRNYFKYVCLILAVLVFAKSNAQNSAREAMERDYPQLMQKYGADLQQKHAHYIFAVDISSSMLQYEDMVKANFLAFINAIPDGDEITLIRVASTAHTDYLCNTYRCIKLNPEVRNALNQDIYSPDFRFLSPGDSKDGSDCYKMAELIVQSINTVGNSDLTFVYMFTDFEYWTHHNGYNPGGEDWASLKTALSEQRRMALCKSGLELVNNGASLHQHAVVKRQLDDVFGSVDYQGVSSAAVLQQWFDHQIANAMAYKLNALVCQDWDKFVQSVDVEVKGKGSGLSVKVKSNPADLVTGFSVSPVNVEEERFAQETTSAPVAEKGGCEMEIGKYVLQETTLFPSYTTFGGDGLGVSIGFQSPYADEIDQLQTVCNDGRKCDYTKNFELTTPVTKVWSSTLPLWVWVLIAVIVLIIIASILYTIFGVKLNREWQVTVVRRDEEGNRVRELSTFIVAPGEIKSTKDRKPSNDWAIKLTAKKYNPLNVFKLGKSGYYVTLENGTFLDVMDPFTPRVAIHTLSPGDEVFVCSYNKPVQIIMQIKSSGSVYKIDLM